jgi:hypothetical protein
VAMSRTTLKAAGEEWRSCAASIDGGSGGGGGTLVPGAQAGLTSRIAALGNLFLPVLVLGIVRVWGWRRVRCSR